MKQAIIIMLILISSCKPKPKQVKVTIPMFSDEQHCANEDEVKQIIE